MAIFVKDPDATLDFKIDWSSWLPTADTITASEWVVPDGITEGTGDQASSFTDTTATIWLSGGTTGTKYDVTNRITTAGGRINDETIVVSVRDT